MANSDQLITLIKSHVDGDDARFRTLALQVAASESRAGHTVLAKAIYDAINTRSIRRLHPVGGALADVDNLLMRVDVDANMSDLVVNESISLALKRIINEYEQRDKLRRYNLDNRHKVLLYGPSGTGKTMSASVLASELGLPLFVVRLEKVITKFMGETGLKLSKIFDFIADVPGVYLFDEFDAIGAQRGIENEVGEQRRILNAFLQLMERPMADSIVVAATNAINSIDTALFRRFDDVLAYSLPTDEEIERLILNATPGKNIGVSQRLLMAMKGFSHAEVCAVCVEALKNELLYNHHVSEGSLCEIAYEKSSADKIRSVVG